MKIFKESPYQICPRCGMKTLKNAESCPDCGLVFSRLAIATNKDAKRLKAKKEKEFIIKTTKLPSDVKFSKLLLLAIFLGAVGAHCFYVGRYLRGSILLGDFIAIVIMTIFNSQIGSIDSGNLLACLLTICGFIMIFGWFLDIFLIITKKFSVPVGIDLDNKDEIE